MFVIQIAAPSGAVLERYPVGDCPLEAERQLDRAKTFSVGNVPTLHRVDGIDPSAVRHI